MPLHLQDVVNLGQEYPQLSFNQVQQFILLASKLKDDILLAQPSSVLAIDPPDIIPPNNNYIPTARLQYLSWLCGILLERTEIYHLEWCKQPWG